MKKGRSFRLFVLMVCFGSLLYQACRSKGAFNIVNDVELEAQTDRLLQPFVQEGFLSGSVLIAKSGRIILAKGYGYANKDKNILNTPETKFRICSMSKMITGLAVLILHDRNMLDIQDPISKYVEGIQYGDKITLFHLLTHTSGIPGYDLDKTRPESDEFESVEFETILGWIRDIKPISNPGERFMYSNSGFVLLSEVIQKVSGLSYEDFVHDNIFKPCGMNDNLTFLTFPGKKLNSYMEPFDCAII